MPQPPKIFVFCNQRKCDGRGQWHVGTAIAEDGATLAGHCSSSHDFLKLDLGANPAYPPRPEYAAHYPDGYEVVFLEGDDAIAQVVATLPEPPKVSP